MNRLTLLVLLSSVSIVVYGFSATNNNNPSSSSNTNSNTNTNQQQQQNQNQNQNQNEQATWEDIGRNLLNLRNVGVPDEILMMTRLDIPNLNKCEVKQSLLVNDDDGTAAGRGLFATQDIMKGDIVTCYPGDVLLQPSGLTGVPEYLEKDDTKLRSLLTKYSIGIKDGYAIMGLPDLDDDMAYVGHIINDGIQKIPTKHSELQSYIYESKNKLSNVEHIPLEDIHMVTIAKRNIKKGEELYVFYGPIYWMDHNKDIWDNDDDDNDDDDQ